MKVIFVDGEKIGNISELHKLFEDVLDTPEHYGENLDALHDVLTSTVEEVGVVAVNLADLAKNIGKRRYIGFMRLMMELPDEKAGFHFSSPFEE